MWLYHSNKFTFELYPPLCLIMYDNSVGDIILCVSGALETSQTQNKNHNTPMPPERRENKNKEKL